MLTLKVVAGEKTEKTYREKEKVIAGEKTEKTYRENQWAFIMKLIRSAAVQRRPRQLPKKS